MLESNNNSPKRQLANSALCAVDIGGTKVVQRAVLKWQPMNKLQQHAHHDSVVAGLDGQASSLQVDEFINYSHSSQAAKLGFSLLVQ